MRNWDFIKLVRTRTSLVRAFNNQKDPHERVKLQTYIAAIDNMLDIMEDHIIDKCLIKILCDICSLPENGSDQTLERR